MHAAQPRAARVPQSRVWFLELQLLGFGFGVSIFGLGLGQAFVFTLNAWI